MFIVEVLHNTKKKIRNFWRDYFTVEGVYTSLLPDKYYAKKLYKMRTGKDLNLKNPSKLNEKLHWLKLYNHNPFYTTLVDKYAVREYISKKIGEEYLVPLIGVWDNVEDIDFNLLPNKFVLKANHDNGVIVCKNKNKLDINHTKKILKEKLNRNYYKKHREWPYKNVPRKIICEQFLASADGGEIVDYKFFCYGGKIRYFMYSLGEQTDNPRNHKFDVNCNSIDYLFKDNPTIDLSKIVLPYNIDKMLELANILCANEPHARIDMYNIDGHIFIGEITFFSGGGFINIVNETYSNELASYIDIESIKKKRCDSYAI